MLPLKWCSGRSNGPRQPPAPPPVSPALGQGLGRFGESLCQRWDKSRVRSDKVCGSKGVGGKAKAAVTEPSLST